MNKQTELSDLDCKIINALQGGFPIVDEPFKEVASWFDAEEIDVIERIKWLLETGILSRFGPLFNSEKMGGAVTLAALCVPVERFDEVAEKVNAHQQVSHNYARSHALNMWFVVSTETPQEIGDVVEQIKAETGLHVYNCPKETEYFIGLRLQV